MLGSLARRERRPLWGALSMLLLFAVGASIFMGIRTRSNAVAEAAKQAKLTAQTALAPLLMPRDLIAPIVGERASELTSAIQSGIISTGPVDRVRIHSASGRTLYAADPKLVGTRPTYLRNLTFEVANGKTQTQVHSGLLQTYVPIWLSPEGTVVVAEMSQAYGPIASGASGTWNLVTLACGLLLVGSTAMVVMTSRSKPAAMAVQVYHQQTPIRLPKSMAAPGPEAPMYQQAGFRAIEEQRQAADVRAQAAEENYRSVQEQLKATLGQMKDLEGRLVMQESQSATAETEIQALRDQLRETAERLHKTELDNNQLRERMALRQRELEAARHEIATIHVDGGDSEDLKARLEAAERRASQLAREAERLEDELDYTKGKFHMTKLSEALREFDGDEIEIDVEPEEDDLFEHPVIIRGNQNSTPEKVR